MTIYVLLDCAEPAAGVGGTCKVLCLCAFLCCVGSDDTDCFVENVCNDVIAREGEHSCCGQCCIDEH